jgi:hypothetical protein
MLFTCKLRIFLWSVVSDDVCWMNSFYQDVFSVCSDKHLRLNHFSLSQNLILIFPITFRSLDELKLNIVKNCLLSVAELKSHFMKFRVFTWFEDYIMINSRRLVSNLNFVKSRVVFNRNSREVDCRWVV